jgi:hypothetical protein
MCKSKQFVAIFSEVDGNLTKILFYLLLSQIIC